MPELCFQPRLRPTQSGIKMPSMIGYDLLWTISITAVMQFPAFLCALNFTLSVFLLPKMTA